jgi:hypothetical protein
MKNLKKDLDHGEGNQVAEGATVFGIGNAPADHNYVATATPLSRKKKSLMRRNHRA